MAWNIYASVYNTVGKRLNTRAAAVQRTRVQDPKGFRTVTTKSQQNQLQGLPRIAHPQAIMRNKMDLWKSTLRLLIHITTNVEGFILNAGRTPGMKHLLDWHSQNLQSQHAAGKPVILSCDCSDAWTARPAHGATANGQKGSASIRADIHMLCEIDHCSKAGAPVQVLAARIPESTLQTNSGDLSVLDAQM